MHSDDNADKLVVRLRISDIDGDDQDDEETPAMFAKNLQNQILHELTLKGIPEITKVSFSTYAEKSEYDPASGKQNSK